MSVASIPPPNGGARGMRDVGTRGKLAEEMSTSRTADCTPAAREGDRVATNKARVKSVEESIRDTEEPEHQLKKNLSGLNQAVFGVGVIIGTGIFVLTGVVAKTAAGPAVANTNKNTKNNNRQATL